MRKILSIIMCICILSAFSGCKKTVSGGSSSEGYLPEVSVQGEKTLSLLYSYGDSFNPYIAETVANRRLATLLYDGLVKTDNNFESHNLIAESVTIEGKVCTVKLKNVQFSDGSYVTAADVVYSYNLAKASERYSYNFYEVSSVAAQDSKTVVFNLTQHDEYFANLITFPILKQNTSGQTDADGKEIAPIGCGRYYLSENADAFEINKNYYGKLGSVTKIKLINSPDSKSTTHYVEVGATNLYYTDDGNIVRMSGKKTDVNLNRLVYIGVNDSYGALASKEMRYAISAAINREAICSTAYYNNADVAKGYFNPSFKPTNAIQTIESKPNTKIMVENLSKIGYNDLNSDGFYANSFGNAPSFTLMVNSENESRVAAAELIAEQCKAVGIKINVVKCTYEQYVQNLSSGNFQLYIGEVKVYDNMDLSQLVLSGGSAAYGVSDKSTVNTDLPQDDETQPSQEVVIPSDSCRQVLNLYRNGECGISDVAATLLTEMPQIPICYLNGVLFYDSEIKGGVEASNSDIYFSIENYEF